MAIACERQRGVERGDVKAAKNLWKQIEEPALMLAAAGLAAGMIFAIFAVFAMAD